MNAKVIPLASRSPAPVEWCQTAGEWQYFTDLSYGLLGLHSAWRRGLLHTDPEVHWKAAEELLAAAHARGFNPTVGIQQSVLNLFTREPAKPLEQTPFLPQLEEWLRNASAEANRKTA